MFKRVLFGSDLSPATEQIINAAGSLRRLGTEEIMLVHCLNIRDVGTLAETLIHLLQPELTRQVEKLQQLGFAVKSEIRLGLPAVEISRAAQENDCAVIVLGSHGYNLTKDILLGGVATAVLHTATRPVLIIKITTAAPLTAWNPLADILYPTDFSDNAEVAFAYLKEIVQAGAEKVTLLHIQDQIIGKHLKDRLAEFNRIDEERLSRLRDELLSTGRVPVNIEVRFGLVAQEILNQIKSAGVSMVVMGTQGRGHIGEMFLGSVSNKVVRYSPVPVLLVPLVR